MESLSIDSAALKIALEAIRRRDRFESEIRDLLASKGHDPEPVVEYLRGRGFLNDARVAEAEVDRLRRKGWGPAKIEAELERRSADVSMAVSSAPIEDARAALAKRFQTPPDRIKAIRFLLSRGFDEETAESAVAES